MANTMILALCVLGLAFAAQVLCDGHMPEGDMGSDMGVTNDQMKMFLFKELDKLMHPDACPHDREENFMKRYEMFNMCMKGDKMEEHKTDEEKMREAFEYLMTLLWESKKTKMATNAFPTHDALMILGLVGKMAEAIDYSHAKYPIKLQGFTSYQFFMLTKKLYKTLYMPEAEAEMYRKEIFTTWAKIYHVAGTNIEEYEAFFMINHALGKTNNQHPTFEEFFQIAEVLTMKLTFLFSDDGDMGGDMMGGDMMGGDMMGGDMGGPM